MEWISQRVVGLMARSYYQGWLIFAMFVGGFCLAGKHMGWMAVMLLIYLAATGLQFYLMGKLAVEQRHDD